MVFGKLDRYMQKNEIRLPSSIHIRINSKWIEDLNVTSKTMKILEENIGSKILDIACSNILFDISSQARETNEKINKLDYIKLKFLHSKGNHQQNKKKIH